jgi:hypothetical protein
MPGLTVPLNIPYPIAGDSLESAVQATPQALAEKINDLLNALAPVAAVPWTTLAMPGAWSAQNTAYARTAGMVSISISGTNGSPIANGELLCTLPPNFRPSRIVPGWGYNSTSGAWFPFTVRTNGECRTAVAGTNGLFGMAVFPV